MYCEKLGLNWGLPW